MILPSPMLKVRMIAYSGESQKILDALRGRKLFHFTDYSDSVERWGFKGIPVSKEHGELFSLYEELQGLITTLEGESRKSFMEDLFPKPIVVKPSNLGIAQIREKASEYARTIKQLEDERASLEGMRSDMLSHRTALALLGGFRRQIEKTGLPRHSFAFFGELVPDELTPLLISLSDNGLDRHIFYKKVLRDDEKRVVMLILSEHHNEKMLQRILKKHDFHFIPIPEDGGGVLGAIDRVRGTLARLVGEEAKVNLRLEDEAARHLNTLRSYLARLKTEIDMINVRNMLGSTDKTTLIEGWIRKKDKGRLEGVVRGAAGDRAEIFYFEPDVKKGDIPVALENPSFVKPFELLTRMFSPPNYGEIDPTPFIAIAFVLFFGIMFADIFDAMMLFAMSFIFYRRFRDSEDAKNIGEILLVCSVSALIFGLIGGEFAGFQIWAKHEILQPANLLVFALFLGLAQIVLGYTLGLVNAVRSRDLNDLLGGKLGWLLIIAGIGLAYFVFWQYAAISVFGLALILAFKGLREALDLTRLLSNLLSYVRLLALNMAHVGLSATFASIIGGLFAFGISGQISGGILIFLAHIFMVLVSLFAVFAHALRLQYVEFFSKFYEGGGTIFNPF
jgi:V/A-type H+-transporting ATPase subunit I